MNFAKFAQTVAVVGLVMAAVWGQSQAAQAEEIVTKPDDGIVEMDHGVTVLAWARVDGVSPSSDAGDSFSTMTTEPVEPEKASTTCCDDVIVDGDIITGENDAQASTSDPEWRYVPVRRIASAEADAADDDDHDILYDPADDLMPPAKPVGDDATGEVPYQVSIQR